MIHFNIFLVFGALLYRIQKQIENKPFHFPFWKESDEKKVLQAWHEHIDM
jgi:hypothetical protein